MRHIFRSTLILLSTLLILLSVTSGAQAQYFGRNKVQYKDFKFQILKTEHFDIYFYDDERDSAARVGRMAERWYARHSELFAHEMKTRQPLVLYSSHPDFEQTNVVGGNIDEGTGGVTEGLKRRVVLPMAGTLAETDHVLGHELVHAFQYDIASQRAAAQGGQGGGGGVEGLPLWFIEGMAEYLSIGPVDPHTAMWIRDAARKEKLPTIANLDDPKYFPYRWGQALWAFIGGRWGDETIPRIYRDALRSGNMDVALKNSTGMNAKELSAAWHTAIHDQYDPILKANEHITSFASGVTTVSDTSKLAMNVSPSLSPDGKQVIYFSSRDMLSIGLYLADAANGHIIRKLVDTSLDPHFSSLEFINSAGAWKPDGKQFVLGAVHDGRAELAIIDVSNGAVAREIPFPKVGEILTPTWSPDGRSVAFSATVGGDSDLFLYDLVSNTERRLTADPFADLQPAWSPDGRKLAFVTDRFSTHLDNLKAGDYQVALFDLESGQIQPVRTFDAGKSINPQWSTDGRRLYFLSDRDGITNVYAVNLESGAIAQVTRVDAGVSGITALSPAISSAIDARSLALSAYESGSYHIYRIDSPDILAGTTVSDGNTRVLAAGLPPAERGSSVVARLLADPQIGMTTTEARVEPYHAKLSLDAVGQPYVSAGISQFGGSVGGGLSFNWSDMLGNHNLFAALNAQTFGSNLSDVAKDTGGLLEYVNLTHRWNWGLSIDQTPYVAGGYASTIGTAGGQNAYLDQTIIQRQVERGLNAMVAYPLSTSNRVEFGAGFSQLSFDQEVRTVASSLTTGQLISDTTNTTSLGSTLRMSSVNAGFVNDNSLFGATSPVAGQRSHFEVSPTFGSLNFTSALADYRRYFMPARFYTIAARMLHYGRYGADSEDPRLIPLFLGYPEFVRGYGINSFTSGECSATTGTCPTFDRLVGSRMLAGNLEFRFPLLRPFGVTDRMYGPLPVEVAFFLDGGVAWNKGEQPFSSAREPVSSGGITLRTNLFGYAVAQIDYARPFDRPGRGWVWGFSLTPGF